MFDNLWQHVPHVYSGSKKHIIFFFQELEDVLQFVDQECPTQFAVFLGENEFGDVPKEYSGLWQLSIPRGDKYFEEMLA